MAGRRIWLPPHVRSLAGPINTWDRQLYRWGNGDLAAGWVRVSGNAVMNGPGGNRDLGNLYPTIDNDDGSQLYWVSRNVLIYGGERSRGSARLNRSMCAYTPRHIHPSRPASPFFDRRQELSGPG